MRNYQLRDIFFKIVFTYLITVKATAYNLTDVIYSSDALFLSALLQSLPLTHTGQKLASLTATKQFDITQCHIIQIFTMQVVKLILSGWL